MVAPKNQSRKATQLVDLSVARHAQVGPEQVQPDAHFDSQLSQLVTATGIDNQNLLQRMVAHGLNAKNVIALKYAPIAEVAWASGRVTSSEYVLAMKPMFSAELFDCPEAVDLFRSWLTSRPPESLWTLSEDYVRARVAIHRADAEQAFGRQLYELAEKVALASGGIVDQGDICAAERLALNRASDMYAGRAA